MDAIIINRVSDRKQKEGYSLDAQRRHGAEYAKKRDFNVLRDFTFQETASKTAQRKKFNEVLTFIENYPDNKTLAVVVEKSDRLGRNHRDKEIVQELYQEGKIEVHLYKEGRIFNRQSNATDIFIDDIMTSVGKYAALNIAREAIKGMKEKAEQGWFPMKAPLGYVNAKDPQGRRYSIVVPDPNSCHIVLRIFELRDEGLSYDAIRMKILESPSLPANLRNRFRQKSSIEQILKREFYGGKFRWRDDWYDGKHELIVPPDLFKRVHNSFKEKGKRLNQKMALFTNWLKCECGCSITYDPKFKTIKATGEKRRYDYYRCSNGKQAHPKLIYVSEDSMLEQFGNAINLITITDNLADDISNALNEVHRRVTMARERDIESYKAGLKAIENAEDRIYDDHLAGLLDVDGYKRQIQRIRGERERFTNLMLAAQKEIDGAYLVTAKKVLELAKQAKTLWLSRTREERKEFLEKILSNRVLDGLTMRYELKRPFRILAEMASSSCWRTRKDSNLRPPRS